MPNFSKKQSKRVSCRQRYKVEKKVRQHLKKQRREAKKNPRHHKPKDPGIPNSLPFKEDILKEAQVHKQMQDKLRIETRKRQKEGRQEQFLKNRDLDDVRKDAEKRTAEFEGMSLLKEHLLSTGQEHLLKDLNFKCFYQEFRKVVEAADVVLEVLDARDPLGTRSPQLEEYVLNKRKRLVLVLNKIDLIPRENLEKWLKHLRNELPTVAFKASTQSQRNNLSRSWNFNASRAPEGMSQSSRCLGASLLMKLLGNYCRNQGVQTCISVGVVGYPNVGKSSLVNSLKRVRSCTVGATPGVTRTMQKVQLDKHVTLVDSPGVVMAKGSSEALVALRNAKKPQSLEDPIGPACSILRRVSKEQLMIHYRLPEFSTLEECFSLLAKRMGLLRKGGFPDAQAAARRVLADWNIGRIKYYTEPPESQAAHISAEVVQSMSAEFDLTSLQEEEQMEFKDVRVVNPADAVAMESVGSSEIVMDGQPEEDGAQMETDQAPGDEFTVKLGSRRKKKAGKGKKETEHDSSAVEGLQQNKARRKEFKKQLKKRKRSEKVANALSDSLEAAFSSLS